MKLPNDVDRKASVFKGLSDERKNQILEHLVKTGEGRRNTTLSSLLQNGGEEEKFIRYIFGTELPEVGESPANKKINPIQRN